MCSCFSQLPGSPPHQVRTRQPWKRGAGTFNVILRKSTPPSSSPPYCFVFCSTNRSSSALSNCCDSMRCRRWQTHVLVHTSSAPLPHDHRRRGTRTTRRCLSTAVNYMARLLGVAAGKVARENLYRGAALVRSGDAQEAEDWCPRRPRMMKRKWCKVDAAFFR